MSPLCAISIDLDSLRCYRQIHGLESADEADDHVIYERCLPRFRSLFARYGVSATFFVVASDVDGDSPTSAGRAQRLRECVVDGHELGNHSYSHFYELGRLDAATISDEIGRAHEVLSSLGPEVVGFRSPGYGLSPALASELERRGYLYDSSILPAPSYFVAKMVVMSALAIAGRPSGAVITDPRMLAAPTQPYHPAVSSPWRRGSASVLEIPIAVSQPLRLPLIGTSLLLAPDAIYPLLRSSVRRLPFFNFELHGIDLADADSDGIDAELVARQPDLRVPLATKLARLERMLGDLIEVFELTTLKQAAMAFV